MKHWIRYWTFILGKHANFKEVNNDFKITWMKGTNRRINGVKMLQKKMKNEWEKKYFNKLKYMNKDKIYYACSLVEKMNYWMLLCLLRKIVKYGSSFSSDPISADLIQSNLNSSGVTSSRLSFSHYHPSISSYFCFHSF